MYLSNWLIIALIIGALVYYYNKKRDRHPYNEYFKRKYLSKRKLRYYRDNNSSLDRLDDDYYDYLTEKCYKKIWYSQNVNKIFPAEEDFVDDLNLCSRLFDFIKDIRDYPQVRGDALCLISSQKYSESNLISIFSDKFEFKDDDDIIECSFCAYGTDFILFLCPSQQKYNKYYPVIIMEKKEGSTKVFLIVRLYYEKEFLGEKFCYYKLEEFRNDYYGIQSLLNIMYEVRIANKLT